MIKFEDRVVVKYCAYCKQFLSYTEFHVSKSSKYDGLSWLCKKCGSAASHENHKQYYKKEKERLKRYQKERRQNTPLEQGQAYNRSYRQKYRETILQKERVYGKKRRNLLGKDAIYRLNNNISKGIWESLQNNKG